MPEEPIKHGLTENQSGFSLLQFCREVIYASRKSKGLLRQAQQLMFQSKQRFALGHLLTWNLEPETWN